MSYPSLVAGLWIAWLVYWCLAARRTKTTRWREPIESRLAHLVPMVLAVFLLIERDRQFPAVLTGHFIPHGTMSGALGTVVVALGLAFAVWARRHLGGNWSGTVTLKVGHTLVRSGPYGYVRHPIYSGLLLAFAGTAIVRGEWRGLVALGLAFVSLAFKIRIEERRMREMFADYEDYCRQTAALIPLVY